MNKKSIQIQLELYRRLLGNELLAVVYQGDGRTVALDDKINPLVDNFS